MMKIHIENLICTKTATFIMGRIFVGRRPVSAPLCLRVMDYFLRVRTRGVTHALVTVNSG